MTSRLRGCLLLLAATSGCTPELVDGRYACGTGEACPPGWTCEGGRCYSGGGEPECRIDAHCDDRNVCTLDICEGVRCAHEPDPEVTECDDGEFCNGADACADGACASLGVAPCDTCSEAGCPGCGAPGQVCCTGNVCNGSACEGGICTACGVDGQRCCPGGGCPTAPNLTCLRDTCTTCGTDSLPCCDGGFCYDGSLCDMSTICRQAAGCGATKCPPGTSCVAGGGCELCGTIGAPCCSDADPRGACTEGFCGLSGTCETGECGQDRGPCCPSSFPCAPDHACFYDPANPEMTGICLPCGGFGEPCCTSSEGFSFTCDPEFACDFTTSVCQDCGGSDELCCTTNPPCDDGSLCSDTSGIGARCP